METSRKFFRNNTEKLLVKEIKKDEFFPDVEKANCKELSKKIAAKYSNI